MLIKNHFFKNFYLKSKKFNKNLIKTKKAFQYIEKNLLESNNMKNTLTTDMPDTTGYNISTSYGSNASPNSYQIVDEIHDLEQRNVEFRHTLLPGTKYAIKLNAKNNRNPYFSHDDEATVIDDETFDELKTPYIPPNGVQTTSIGGVTYAGEFPSNFTEMPYYTNVDGYRPDNGTDDPLYVKYISKDDLEAIDLSNITFGGHRTVAVFDPDLIQEPLFDKSDIIGE